VLAFHYDQERNLHALRAELRAKTYRPGGYYSFVICEPKRRLISAAPYRDRVVHHALCNVIEPIFNRGFIHGCYANRLGKGTHKALGHFVRLARRFQYCLRADVEKYFPTVDHAILKETIRRRIKCQDTLWLIDAILDNSNEQEAPMQWFPGDDLVSPAERRRGLPIGNLTSQLWANVYLDDMDQAMAKRFGGRRLLRYVDDMALFSDSAQELEEARAMMAGELERVRQRLHPAKTQIVATRQGVHFLGFLILPDRIRVRQENLRRARRRLRWMQEEYREGRMGRDEVSQSVRSWIAHLEFGDTWKLREQVFSQLAFARG
jgi:retron-type reverse transcriptase